jgi:hypothetical protein
VKLHEFNWRRFCAVVRKEFIQMRRDRMTFGMMIGVPMIQLILFGYAINSDPKHLPTAVYSQDNSVFARSIVWGMHNSSYFDITREPKNEAEIQELLARKPRCNSSWKFPWTFRANCCAAKNRICSSKPTRPIRRRSVTRLPR